MKTHLAAKILLVICFFINSCSDNSLSPEAKQVIVSIDSILPDRPLKVGELFTILFKIENLDSGYINNCLQINNLDECYNYPKGDTLFCYVPYMPVDFNKWSIRANVYNYKNQSAVYVQDTVTVIPENCNGNICVKWSDLDRVTEYDSYYDPEYYGDRYKWVSKINSDTITITQKMPGSDEGYVETKLVFLDKGANLLPELLHLSLVIYDFGSNSGDTLKSGIIKIQDWNNSGVYSGIILSELKPFNVLKPELPTRRVFWFRK